MDDIRVGEVFRAVRIRRGLSQSDVAAQAHVSFSTVSLIERGQLQHASIATIRDVGRALRIAVPFAPRWRGPELARLLDQRHSEIVAAVVVALRRHGWEPRPELTFSRWGERGSIDVFASRPAVRAVLVVECKSRVVDLQDLLSGMDRKRRLAADIASTELGWRPGAVGSVLALPDGSSARARVVRHTAVFDAALPARTLAVRSWLKAPTGPLSGIWFVHCCDRSKGRAGGGGPIRVVRRSRAFRTARLEDQPSV